MSLRYNPDTGVVNRRVNYLPRWASGGFWRTVGGWIDNMESAANADSLAILCCGDSKTHGDMLYRPQEEAWPNRLNRLLQGGCRVGGVAGFTDYWQPVERDETRVVAGAGVPNDSVYVATTAATAMLSTLALSAATGAVWHYCRHGFEFLALALSAQGSAGTFKVDVYAGDVTGTLPATDGDLLTYTHPTYVASWAKNTWSQNIMQTDASANLFGETARVMFPVNSVALSLAAQPNGCTVVVRVGNTTTTLEGILTTRGHTLRGYAVAVNTARWGRNRDGYYSTAAVTSAFNYWPRAGGADAGSQNRFQEILRWMRQYQHSGWAATTPGVTKLAVLDALYTNVPAGEAAFATMTDGQVDALVVNKLKLRDDVVAAGGAYAFLALVPTSVQGPTTKFPSFCQKMRNALTGGREGCLLIPEYLGTYDRAALKFPVKSRRNDNTHEGEESNVMTAKLVWDALRAGRR